MTSKHFKALAHTLNANFAPLELVQDMADMCEEFNERFDRVEFMRAATLNIGRKVHNDKTTILRETAR